MHVCKFINRLTAAVVPVLVVFAFSSHCGAAAVSAVVYPKGAKITEQISARIISEKGRHSARFDLPVHADPDSLTIQPVGTDDVWISSVSMEIVERVAEEKLESLKKTLEKLLAEKSVHDNRIRSSRASITFWEHLSVNLPGNTPDVEKLAESLATGIFSAGEEIYTHQSALKDIEKQIQNVQDEINRLTGHAEKKRRATVYLEGAPRSEIELICTYRTPNCRWYADYRLNAQPEAGTISFLWSARIEQNTGSNWENVKISLATAPAHVRPEPPPTRDWILEPKQRPETYRKSDRMAMPVQMAAEADRAAGAAPPEPPRENRYLFDTYELGRHSLAAGESRRLTIRKQEWPATFAYLVRPQETAQAFLYATLDAADDTIPSLPGGTATFLVDHAFIAARPFSMHDQKEKLFFGTDPHVTVDLKLLEKESGERGVLFGGKKRQRWHWQVSVENHKTRPVDIVMEDAAPQIRDERIEPAETFTNIRPEKQGHILVWSFAVPAGGAVSFTYGHTVTYPGDMEISLGGR